MNNRSVYDKVRQGLPFAVYLFSFHSSLSLSYSLSFSLPSLALPLPLPLPTHPSILPLGYKGCLQNGVTNNCVVSHCLSVCLPILSSVCLSVLHSFCFSVLTLFLPFLPFCLPLVSHPSLPAVHPSSRPSVCPVFQMTNRVQGSWTIFLRGW